jgi:hypothetical protein
MSKDASEPAFPVSGSEYGGTGTFFGMSLRDYFAAKAMQSSEQRSNAVVPLLVAQRAYALADAMLAARSA